MPDDLSTFATLLLAVITLSTAAGVGFQRGKIGQLRGDLKESDERADRLAAELGETRHELAESRAETKSVRTDLDALGRVVTGEAHWVAIGQLLSEHHANVTIHQGLELQKWEHMEKTLERIAKATEERA